MKSLLRFKAFVHASILILTVFAANVIPATAQPKPGDEHKKLQVSVGEWSYEGIAQKTPFSPAGKFSGKSSIKWTLNGFFIQSHWKDTSDASYVQEGIVMQGYDPEKKAYVSYSFENDGSVTPGSFTIKGNATTMTGSRVGQDGKTYHMRIVVTYSADGMSNIEKAEYSADGGRTWKLYYECKAQKSSK